VFHLQVLLELLSPFYPGPVRILARNPLALSNQEAATEVATPPIHMPLLGVEIGEALLARKPRVLVLGCGGITLNWVKYPMPFHTPLTSPSGFFFVGPVIRSWIARAIPGTSMY
jgi:hypothetical protein